MLHLVLEGSGKVLCKWRCPQPMVVLKKAYKLIGLLAYGLFG
jgi:hypothetical protein